MTIEWGNPGPTQTAPRVRVRPTKWQRIGETLRSRPGEWAIVERFEDPDGGYNRDRSRAKATARNLCCGLYNGCAEVEAVARDVDGWRVYARYVGGQP